mgnify:CR=1 FL=1
MIDAENLIFGEDAVQLGVEGTGAGQIGAERFAGGFFRAVKIEAVVVDLIRHAELHTEFTQRRASRRSRAAEASAEIAREREKFGGLHRDDFEIVGACEAKIVAAIGLKDFAGADGLRRGRNDATNFRRRKTRGQPQRVRKKAVAEQHGNLISPIRRERRALSADACLVHDVVVDERREVDHLDDDGDGGVLVGELAGGVGAKADERGPELLALARERVLRKARDLGIERPHLLAETRGHGLENLRIIQHDAVEVLESMIQPGGLAGIHVFYPDPWPKKRHHKRRIVNNAFLELVCRKLKPGGIFHAAPDGAASGTPTPIVYPGIAPNVVAVAPLDDGALIVATSSELLRVESGRVVARRSIASPVDVLVVTIGDTQRIVASGATGRASCCSMPAAAMADNGPRSQKHWRRSVCRSRRT